MSIITIRPQTADEIAIGAKSEAGRRILAVMKDHWTEINMAALASSLNDKKLAWIEAGMPDDVTKPSVDDRATAQLLADAFAWVAACRGKAAELIQNDDETYEYDSHWPVPPDGLDALLATL